MITKYNKFNEGIKHLLVGPSEKEVWNSYEGNILFKTPPPTLKDFLDKLINILEISGDINGDFYTKYNKNDRFFIAFKIENNELYYIHPLVRNILYYYYLNDDKEYDYYVNKLQKSQFSTSKKTLMYYVLIDYFTNKYDRYLDVNTEIFKKYNIK